MFNIKLIFKVKFQYLTGLIQKSTEAQRRTFASLLFFLLLTELVQGQVCHLHTIHSPGQHCCQGVHDVGPLVDELLPVRQGGQDTEQLIPQLPGDVNAQVGSDPSHNEGLREETPVAARAGLTVSAQHTKPNPQLQLAHQHRLLVLHIICASPFSLKKHSQK